MKMLTFVLLSVLITDPGKISKINRAKEEAKKAYQAGDYATAITKYTYLTDSLAVNEDELRLNLANAYFQVSDTASAIGHYQTLTQSNKNTIRSTAQQQIGVIKNKQGKFEEALNHFKEAIKSNPANDDARYNYELLKRKLDEEKKQEQQKQDQQQDKQDQQNDQQKKDEQKEQEKKDKDKQDQEKKDQDKNNDPDKDEKQKDDQQKEEQQNNDQQEDKKENKPSSEKLEQMKITEDKAKMILDAMKNQEIQYLQQNKRKATQPKDKNKPDW
jgi:Ca-activated chloride channel homolog